MSTPLRQIILKRGNLTVSRAYTGANGELTFDTTVNSVRIHDGHTPGGKLISGSSYVSETPPSPSETAVGQLWFNLQTGITYMWVDDGDSKQWVSLANPLIFPDHGDVNINPNVGNVTVGPVYGNTTILGNTTTINSSTTVLNSNTVTFNGNTLAFNDSYYTLHFSNNVSLTTTTGNVSITPNVGSVIVDQCVATCQLPLHEVM